MKVGFIGLGVMGQSMARHVLDGGYDLFVYNRTKAKADDLVAAGAHWCDSPQALAGQVDLVLSIVGYPDDVRDVYLGDQGLFAGAHEGQIFVDMTTSTPSLAQELAQVGQDKGIQVLDGPVTGGDVGAREGRLTCLLAGDQDAAETIRPVLDSFCATIQYFGQAGAGQHAKMANQIMIASTMLGVMETLVYAKTAGLDVQQVIDTLSSGAAGNFSLTSYGPRILKGDYTPGFFVKHFIKDLGIALAEADRIAIDLPACQMAYDFYQRLADKGYQDAGTQALMKLWDDNY